METVTYVAAGGVVAHDGRMLLLNRPSRGEVRLPKGHVEEGETRAEAALRETIEETGFAELAIVADLGEQVVEFDYQGKHYRRTEHYFLMRKLGDGQEPRPPHDEVDFQPDWVALDEAPGRLTFTAEQDVAHRAITVYREDGAS